MSSRHLLDPQLRDFFDAFPKFELNDDTVGLIRAIEASQVQLNDTPPTVSRREHHIPGYQSDAEVRLLIYEPAVSGVSKPAFLHMHGGGLVLGSPEQRDKCNLALCERLQIVIVSVDYRLAPEHPFPAALHDCYAALTYMHDAATDLQVDVMRIAVGGESAGGGLAASLSLFARDKGEYAICHQHLVYPMLDSRTGFQGRPIDPTLGEYCWTRQANVYGWGAYLGKTAAHDAYLPAHTKDLSDLPPVWLCVGDMDLFLPEVRYFRERLSDAGVKTNLDIYSGCPHAFNEVETADITTTFEQDFIEALKIGVFASDQRNGFRTDDCLS